MAKLPIVINAVKESPSAAEFSRAQLEVRRSLADIAYELVHSVGAAISAAITAAIAAISHSDLADLTTADDHTQYAKLAGRSTGQTLIGGTASGDDLTLQSTSNATKGSILFGTSAYDEVNNRLGIGIAAPTVALDVSGQAQVSSATYPPTQSTRTTAETAVYKGAHTVRCTSSGDMTDGFGPGIFFVIRDTAGTDNIVGVIACIRDGQDDSGRFVLMPAHNGSYGTNYSNIQIPAHGGLYIDYAVNGQPMLVLDNSPTSGDNFTNIITTALYRAFTDYIDEGTPDVTTWRVGKMKTADSWGTLPFVIRDVVNSINALACSQGGTTTLAATTSIQLNPASGEDVDVNCAGVGKLHVTGGCTGTGDLSWPGGNICQIGHWFQDEVAKNQTDVGLGILGQTAHSMHEHLHPFRTGSVIGIQLHTNASRVTGTCSVEAWIAGSASGLKAELNAGSVDTTITLAAKDTYPFAAGDHLTIKVTTDGSWGPVTADILCELLIEQ